ncbi:hypothetical protein ACTSKR_16375 [Chitinibacteraceae bacterium HSL-7]
MPENHSARPSFPFEVIAERDDDPAVELSEDRLQAFSAAQASSDMRIELAVEAPIVLDLDEALRHLLDDQPAARTPFIPVVVNTEPVTSAPEPLPTPAPPAPKLGEAEVAELTASVAAHLAVEVAMEVERLSRQHFQAMMATLYADAAGKLATQITQQIESSLAPRIEALVQDELRRNGLIPKED